MVLAGVNFCEGRGMNIYEFVAVLTDIEPGELVLMQSLLESGTKVLRKHGASSSNPSEVKIVYAG